MSDPIAPDPGLDGRPDRPRTTLDPATELGSALARLIGERSTWRSRLDDLTGGLASAAWRWRALGGAAILLAVLVGMAAVWWPRAAPAPQPDLPRIAATAPPSTPPSTGAAGAVGGEALAVHVVGAVAAPGVQRLAPGSLVLDAVAAAGGAGPDADLEQLNLAEPVRHGSQIRVPRRGEVVADPIIGGVEGDPGAEAGRGEGSSGAPVSINRASADELEALPGVGPVTAAAIVAHREEHGPFRSVDDLLDVRGIGPARLEDVRPLVDL